MIVIVEMMGIPADDREAFRRWSDAAVGFNAMGEGLEGSAGELTELKEYLQGAIDRARAEPGDDLVHRLVGANDDGSMSDDELLASCVLLLVAGNETTTKLITNAVLELARHPEHRDLLVEQPELIGNAVEELLRFDGTVQSTFPVVTEETEFRGETLQPGTMVLVMVSAANRDPEKFTNPDLFNLTRDDAREHLGLGFGIHCCLGAATGRLETKVAIEALLHEAPNYPVGDRGTSVRTELLPS